MGKSAITAEQLAERLRCRRGEIEQAALGRVHAVSDPGEVADPGYAQGLRVAVAAGIDYGLAAVGSTAARPASIPPVLLAQARLAARNGVSLDTVLRRYFSAYTLLGDFLVEEAEREGLQNGALQGLLRSQAARFDRVLAAVCEEYGRAGEIRLDSVEQRRAETVQRLLAGELLDTPGLAAELAYDFEGFHLGVVGSGPGAAERTKGLADALDCRLLLVARAEGNVWAWLGSRRGLDPDRVGSLASLAPSERLTLALGEPGQGLAGWRLTHRQAAAALPIALRGPQPLVRYAKVALLASVLQDELLTASLRELYLAPLEVMRDGGRVARETLRAYFAADRNASSAAAALGVKRHTVTYRLRATEKATGHRLENCLAELEIALRLDELGNPAHLWRGPDT